jgi:uncharacterized membrane protein
MALLGALALPFLPEQVPSHWNMAGEVDGYTNRWLGAFLLPTLAGGVLALLVWLPRVDPRQAAYARFGDTYRMMINAVMAFFLLLQVVTLGFALGVPLNVTQWVGVGVGLLFAALGNEMGRVEPNHFVGFRTPWTLANPEVWRRTHRVGGRAMVLAGIVAALGSLALNPPWAFAVLMVSILGSTAFVLIYSYRLHTRGV